MIVRSTIDLGRNLGLDVVAEGMESVEVLERLRSLGCDVAQGFLMSRPVPASELTSWLDVLPARNQSQYWQVQSSPAGVGPQQRTSVAADQQPQFNRLMILAHIAQYTLRLAAVELVCAAQAVDLRGRPGELGSGTGDAYQSVRQRIAFTGAGESPTDELEPLVRWLREEGLASSQNL